MAELASLDAKNATLEGYTYARGSQRVQDPAYNAFLKFNGATLQHLELPRQLWPTLYEVLRSGALQAEDDQAEEDSDQPAIGPPEEATQIGPSPVCPRADLQTLGSCQEQGKEEHNHGSRCSSEAGDLGSHACSVLDETASTVSTTTTTITSSSKVNLLLSTAASSPGGSAADLSACVLQAAGGTSVLDCTELDTDTGSEGAADTDDAGAVNDGDGASGGNVASITLLSRALGLRAVRDSAGIHRRVAVVARESIRAGCGLLAAAPLASAPSCRRLLDALARDTCLLVRLAELLAPPDEEGQEAEQEEEEAEEPRSMHEVLMEQVGPRLLAVTSEYEVPPTPGAPPHKFKYVLPPALARMRVSATPHLAVAPFPFWTVAPAASGSTADQALPTHGSPGEAASEAAGGGWRAREFHMAVLAWPLRNVAEGEEVTRAALPLGLSDFSSYGYWEAAYQAGGGEAQEWYTWGPALERFLAAAARLCAPAPSAVGAAGCGQVAGDQKGWQARRVLVAGCGNSALGYHMWERGYPQVDNVDYVPDVVHAMNEQYGEYGSQLVAGAEGSAGRRGRQHSGAVRWLVGDLTAMAWAGNGEYDLVVDKATLDALMSLPVSAPAVAAAACGAVGGDGRGTGVVQGGADGGCKWRSGPEQLASVHQYLREMVRITAPDGRMLLLTLRPLDAINQLLAEAAASLAEAPAPSPASPPDVPPAPAGAAPGRTGPASAIAAAAGWRVLQHEAFDAMRDGRHIPAHLYVLAKVLPRC